MTVQKIFRHIRRNSLYLLLPFFFLYNVSAQEYKVSLQFNPAVAKRAVLRQNKTGLKSMKISGQDTLEMPFFDDFSHVNVFPDSSKWTDREAYVNNDYAVDPPSIGVATMDAINDAGVIYPDAGSKPFIADHLTSHPIDLSSGENIFLSFFYQPQGNGDNPETGDSLLLDFYAPSTAQWITVWSVPGDTLHPFRQVILPVNDTAFLKKGFRFRFRNICSLPTGTSVNPGMVGNGDQWNIDYIYLNKDRSANDTVFIDAALLSPPASLLKNYTSIPWSHFSLAFQQEINPLLVIRVKNNGNQISNIIRNYEISETHTPGVTRISGGAANLNPGEIVTFRDDLFYDFEANVEDSALFKMKAVLVTDALDFSKLNDTAVSYQKFLNYYAYDDGSAENGYGLYGAGSQNGMVAYKFDTYKGDTLRAVQMYFNQTLNNASQQYFKLVVWDDNDGEPGDVLYSAEGYRPQYGDSLNQFINYELDSAIFVQNTFYVGWQQVSTIYLNIGLDENSDHSDKLYYNLDGTWNLTSIEGTVMMRPVLGKALGTPTSVDNILTGPVNDINIYPNPASDFLTIDFAVAGKQNTYYYILYNLSGQIIRSGQQDKKRISVSDIPEGLYLLKVVKPNQKSFTKKILIAH
ncbi:MAG TPA: T9SS type A sorting domain-containing protein [Bacteroidales bacterium]|nr:T9SS type A sorting domain-containing protein [Bacteroidales bacterium]